MSESNQDVKLGKNEIEMNKQKNTENLNHVKLNNNNKNSFIYKLENTPLIVNRLDYYANAIPLGAFCFSVSFILFGFIECEIFKNYDVFTFIIILLFGGIGQITAGIFEFIKSRTFPTTVYLLYGLYFISFFIMYYYKDEIYDIGNNRIIYFGTWAVLTFPLVIGSFAINVIYILQNVTCCAFFVVRCIGECKKYNILNTKVSGILELVTGFSSLYLCFRQVLNEHYRCTTLPTFPIIADNEIDIITKTTQNN